MELVLTRLYLSGFPLLSLVLLGSEVGFFADSLFLKVFGLGLSIFLFAALGGVRGYNLWVSLACLGLGTILGFAGSMSIFDLLSVLGRSGTILVFLAFVPSISVALGQGRYLESLSVLVRHRGASGVLRFFFLSGLLMIMAFVLNIGSIPTLQKLLDRSKLSKSTLSSVYSAGYSANILISPFDAIVQGTIITAGATYGSYLLVGLGTVVLLVLFRALLRGFESAKEDEASSFVATADEVRTARTSSLGMTLHISLLFVLTAAGNSLVPARYPLLLTGVIVYFYSWLWGQSLGACPGFLWKKDSGYREGLLGYRGFLPFLISAGFLGAILSQTPVAGLITQWVAIEGGGSPYVLLLMGSGLTALFSLVGVHMLISISILSAVIVPGALGLGPEQFALYLLLCWIGAMNISPLVPFSAVVGQALAVSAARVSFRYNLIFGLGIIIAGPLVVLVWSF